jgi:hypothetical protein
MYLLHSSWSLMACNIWTFSVSFRLFRFLQTERQDYTKRFVAEQKNNDQDLLLAVFALRSGLVMALWGRSSVSGEGRRKGASEKRDDGWEWGVWASGMSIWRKYRVTSDVQWLSTVLSLSLHLHLHSTHYFSFRFPRIHNDGPSLHYWDRTQTFRLLLILNLMTIGGLLGRVGAVLSSKK